MCCSFLPSVGNKKSNALLPRAGFEVDMQDSQKIIMFEADKWKHAPLPPAAMVLVIKLETGSNRG